MKLLKLAAIAGSSLALAAGAASAQYSAQPDTQSGSMQSGKTDGMTAKPAGKMSASDMKMMKSCSAMGHDAMMKAPGCMKLVKAHPEMMKPGGSTTSGSMTSGGMTSGDMSPGSTPKP
jgi:hypothetical protein